ncbi:hypothetical protein ACA910_003933 [Epithemia clementina (nom. ined.)]
MFRSKPAMNFIVGLLLAAAAVVAFDRDIELLRPEDIDRDLQTEEDSDMPSGRPSDMPLLVSPSGMPLSSCVQDPPRCDDGSCGDCDLPHFGTGCSCDRCECTVCARDPYCCNTNWDGICIGEARDWCGCGGGGSVTPSLAPSQAPSKLECVEEPSACDDGTCGDCRTEHLDAGCSCERCECAVCKQDPYCCDVEWDFMCVDHAEQYCNCDVPPTASPKPSSSPFPSQEPSISAEPTSSSHPTYGECDKYDLFACDDGFCGNCFYVWGGMGCSCDACECAVCSDDSYCCAVSWDSTCAESAKQLCNC